MNLKTTTDKLRDLRKATGASAVSSFDALKKFDFDYDKALSYIQSNVTLNADTKLKSSVSNGVVLFYTDDINISGITLTCASDSVSRNEEFLTFAKNICVSQMSESDISEQAKLLSLRFGEKITWIKNDLKINQSDEHVVVYNHHNLRSASFMTYTYVDADRDRGDKPDTIFPFGRKVTYNNFDILAQKILFHMVFVADASLTVEALMEQKYFLDDEAPMIKEYAKNIKIINIGNLVLPKDK